MDFGPYFVMVSLVVFVVLITVITLVFSTRQVTKGYVLNSLEAAHQDFVKVSERQDMQISQVRSLNYIKETSKVRSMRPANAIVYISDESAIARR